MTLKEHEDVGSTAVGCFVFSDKIITVNLGDSGAFLISSNSEWLKLTTDHKPNLENERRRIEASGQT